jgi:hypothetical protein
VKKTMTEEKWLAATNPLPLLMHVKRQGPGLRSPRGRRKFRLFACACVERVRAAIGSGPLAAAVAAAERFASGEIDYMEVADAWQAIKWPEPQAYPQSLYTNLWRVCHGNTWVAVKVWRWTSQPDLDQFRGNTPKDEKLYQTALVRDIFGNPFRPVAFDPRWRSAAVVGLAEAVYADREFDRLPVLADALEEAGCDHADVLAHCRGGGPHARGCWVVDGILGKT